MILSVSELNEQIKGLLESHFLQVFVEGEVSRPTYHSSGHLYFSLKDKNSVVKCVMFRSSVNSLRFRLEDGQKVIVGGKIGVYSPRGEYQIYAITIEPSGIGALKVAFEQLKLKLQQKGYFDNKKPIPKKIESIAIVTSLNGAALTDMLRVLQKRWPLVKVYVIDTLVQGKEAAEMIAGSIEYADGLGVDVIIISRGGGSIEDLWAFNEEVVADAIYRAKTPVVSAIGHERDYLISDFVADLRAPTPSAAIEMLFDDKMEKLIYLDELMERFDNRVRHIVFQKEQELIQLIKSLTHLAPFMRIEQLYNEINVLRTRLNQAIDAFLQKEKKEPEHIEALLQNQMENILMQKRHITELLEQKLKGAIKAKELPYGVAQVVKNNRAVTLESVNEADVIELQDLKYRVKAKVLSKDAI